jgi:hypothetical protein
MAYANLAATGRLVDTADGKAGFTVSAEAGAGLKAGAGFRVFARFGLDDPSRMIRRTVDVLVDDTLQRIAERTADAAVLTMVEELKAPAKMALRACFELGSQLARNGGAFNAADAPVIAQRCVQVVFEEGQRLRPRQDRRDRIHRVQLGTSDHGVRRERLEFGRAGASRACATVARHGRRSVRAQPAQIGTTGPRSSTKRSRSRGSSALATRTPSRS